MLKKIKCCSLTSAKKHQAYTAEYYSFFFLNKWLSICPKLESRFLSSLAVRFSLVPGL